MIVHKLKIGSKVVFCGSETEARKEFHKYDNADIPVQFFAECCTVVYVDPGKAGIIAALNKHCGG